ncbi:Cmr6 family CRISPR-associated RAMP protein [Calothrix sp. PCC 7716]|nr:Cmr6 family CRISPR-associated RAMP protein [Calothrix sp. PCC 7716]
MNSNFKPEKSNLYSDIWRNFVQAELKNKSTLGTLLESAVFGVYENQSLTLYFKDEAVCKKAQGKRDSIQKKLTNQFRLPCNRISFITGSAPITSASSTPTSTVTTRVEATHSQLRNPLQALYWTQQNFSYNKDEETEQRIKILTNTVSVEQSCNKIYEKLRERTLKLVDNNRDNTLSVDFNWRLRVGGTRGFRELLLPVLHPVFGIPYIPASTLKGAARAWAQKQGASTQVTEILGMLEGKNAIAAKVEFLDAFPIRPCLSIDIATPQWTWKDNLVKYQSEPHSFLSLHQPKFLIGLRLTTLGKQYQDKINQNQENQEQEKQDIVKIVKQWLENALAEGIGSRVSSGYGHISNTPANIQPSNKATKSNYEFELWTQGIYGYNPPTKDNNYQGDLEFRPTSVRGILRYWFRAVALSLYNASDSQILEAQLFGELGQPGKMSISTKTNLPSLNEPYCYRGKIYLSATETKYLHLAEQLLILASHLGGVGRGSRRPLHLLHGRTRGCHWEVTKTNSELPLTYNESQWSNLFKALKEAFQKIQPSTRNYISSPGVPGERLQDVLDTNAQVWLVKSPSQIQPQQFKNWSVEGSTRNAKGEALDFLYNNTRFKGVGKGGGNENVGGSFGTPSYVWIKSIFPYREQKYQVVTIFGCDHQHRLNYAKELDKLRRQNQALLVFGTMP